VNGVENSNESLRRELVELRGRVVELEAARRSGGAANDDINDIVRHDLKAPLSGMVAMVESLATDVNLSDEQRRALRLIVESGRKMLNMINVSLVFKRVELQAYHTELAMVDMVAVVGRVFSDLEALRRGKRLQAVLLVDGVPASGGSSFMVRGDDSLCYSMAFNLLKNACEASPAGERVTVSLYHDGKRMMEIHNLGAVPEPIRGRFFEKYVTHGKTFGTGLGTYSAKIISEKLGGAISMRTCEEKGTTIAVSLPGDHHQD